GDWSNQSKNIIPFFTASFSEEERGTINKKITTPYKFLFVGNLVPGKQPAIAFQIVEDLNKRYIPSELHVYGNGELMSSFQNQAKNKAYIHLNGNQPLKVLKQAYKDAHFLILASKSEGWPKAVAEAMFFGCIPVVTPVSCVPWMVGGGSRGILISGKENRTERREKRNVVESGLLDTFQKNRQFECLPDSPEGERGNLSRTGFSETLEVTSVTNNEDQDVLD